MCGITGWVDHGRDLTRCADTVQAMVATMACRGPDAAGVYLKPQVALGHRRLAVIDVEGGRQPMSHGDVAMTYSGEVYNFRELRAELRGRGHEFRTESDTEVVLHAYLEWGESFVDRLNGMYAFAVWDGRTGTLLLVRDRMGIKPLYYQEIPGGILFGSEPKAILASGEVEAAVDADGLRELLGFVKTPGTTYFRGMRELRPGHVLRFDRNGSHLTRYWRLEAYPHPDDLDTTVDTVRDLLQDTVTRQLVSDVPLCTLLSGGLDSSVITGLAQRSLTAAGTGPVRSFAVDFVGQTENFRPDAMRDTPDGPYVHDLAEHAGTDHTDVVLSTSDLMDPAARNAALVARDAPPFGDMDTSLYLLFKAVRARSTVALSGESADEVFGGYKQFHDPEIVATPTFPWLALRRQGRGRAGASALLTPDLARTLDLDAYVADRYAEALAEIPRLDGEEGLERRMREVCHLHLTRFVQILLDRKDRMSMAVGLEVRVPFCDHRLVQYVFNTPWAFKTFDGREKSLLRAAGRDVLPQSIIDRVKSPYPSTQDPTYHEALREETEKLLADDGAPAFQLFDRGVVTRLARIPAGGEQFARLGLEMVLNTNAWLLHHHVRLV
ncbi:asparagine synthase (glutamine-hydrolyzing) [Actinocatenispora rupis]|uniref:asparagine synthase (glutamine-hydrolyzing) n=1 Tax=Actinocatenispora rupis TaxID=519421 RepID=A0A8J3NEQ4_9ACTN|nr:asparagine synthase (glutamine-hydrolyzing) [Actinocatenispora rupis]GID16326.1 asparagine synthetase B [Actinocatenispora rupis]